MTKQTKNEKPAISKKDFIDFLANASPEEINDYIKEKGKPKKVCWPMFFFPRDDDPK